MKRLLIALGLVGCASGEPKNSEPPGSPGSHLIGAGHVYFEQQTADGGWERIGITDASGGNVFVGQPAKGTWYLPPKGGPYRIRVDNP